MFGIQIGLPVAGLLGRFNPQKILHHLAASCQMGCVFLTTNQAFHLIRLHVEKKIFEALGVA